MDSKENRIFSKRLTRTKFVEFLAQLPTFLIGMEACGSSDYWARTMKQMGHDAKIIAPQYVKPFVKTNKNDQNDAEGIAIAVTRPE